MILKKWLVSVIRDDLLAVVGYRNAVRADRVAGAALCREGAIRLSALGRGGVPPCQVPGSTILVAGIAVVGLCLLPVYAPKDLCLCCERLPLGSFLAVTPCGFSAVLFCANLRPMPVRHR